MQKLGCLGWPALDERLLDRRFRSRLQQLEQDKIITKKVYAEVPPKVEYTLTEKGRSLHKVIKDLSVWGDERC